MFRGIRGFSVSGLGALLILIGLLVIYYTVYYQNYKSFYAGFSIGP